MKMRQIASGIALILTVTHVTPAGGDGINHKKPKHLVNVKIVAVNDFHGQLEPPSPLSNVPALPEQPNSPLTSVGGIDWIAGYIAGVRNKNTHTAVVSAGDLIGASPLLSALFHDEGTIETMNRAGLEINAVGNHEFDEGKDELLRMQKGGCHPKDENSCQGDLVGTPVPFEGADFKFLAANVVETTTGKTLFSPYVIKKYDSVKIAFIGLTLKETPSIVTPTGVAGLKFKDEAATINALIPTLYKKDAKAIVVLIHQGGTIPVAQAVSILNTCDGDLEGSPIKTIVNQLSNSVDLVISGHTHQAYNCKIATLNKRHLIPVTSANSQGRVLTDIDMVIDAKSGKVQSIHPVNVAVDTASAAITPNADIKRIVDNYKKLVQPIANRVIGSISATLSTTANLAGESVMGDVIADAQLDATKAPGFGDAVVAFMNPGGIRADLTFKSGSAGEGNGKVTFGEAFAVQPFGSSLVTLTLTGAQIEALLEQQFTGCANVQPFNRILSASEGFTYEWNSLGAACDKINPAGIKINGFKVDPAVNYRITVNSFLADGGDNFTVLTQGRNRLGGAQDSDALAAYFATNSPVSPGFLNRIRQLP